jgi:hypothetical protein
MAPLLPSDTPTLQKHFLALSNQQIRNETIQHRDVIRGYQPHTFAKTH